MGSEQSKRTLSVLALIGAALLLVFYFVLTFAPSQRKTSPASQAVGASQQKSNASSTTKNRGKLGGVEARASLQEQRELSAGELYKLASPAVVLIEVFDDEGHKRSQGSGFVSSASGQVTTNYHVVRGAYRVTAKFADGTWDSIVGVIGYDQNIDVAVVQLTRPPSAVLALGDSDRVQVGQRVVAVGSPLGLQNTLTEGIVSAVRAGLIQTSAPISPGSSGGPILNTDGEVIGIATSFMREGQNLNFAVPVNWAKRYLGQRAPRSLSEVTAENTVVERVLYGSVLIAAGEARSWQIRINSNTMSNPEIHGEVSSVGGVDGKITLALFSGNTPIYNCRQTYCGIHEDLSDGVYTLVVDNSISAMFSRTVTAQIAIRYVK